MKQLTAFMNKEFLEVARTGKLLILTIVFVLFGIMNPAIAKLTPWLMETMADSLAGAGLTVAEVEVDALTSWTQFYKNMPIALIIFLLLFSSTLTAEYQKGTLINMVTKGLKRWKIIVSKVLIMAVFWTLGYWISFGITFGYNAYFWDNSVACNLLFSAVCFWLMGLWLVSLIVLMSSVFQTSSAVIIGTGGVFLAAYLLGFLPDISNYLPVQLMNSASLLAGISEISEYLTAVSITAILFLLDVAGAVFCFNKRSV